MLWRAILSGATALGLFVYSPSTEAQVPLRKDRAYYEQRGFVIWEAHTKEKLMALTFDDGPDQEKTDEILNLLEQYQAKSTFFVIGRKVLQYPDVVRRIVREGHEVANHTFSHVFFKLPASEQLVQSEIEQTEEAIFITTGIGTKLFRPPGGMYDETVIRVSSEMGLFPVMWSWHQDTRDWAHPGVQKIIRKVLKNARSGDIVLFHDHVAGKSQTIPALKVILPELKARGYRLVTVSELIQAQKNSPIPDH